MEKMEEEKLAETMTAETPISVENPQSVEPPGDTVPEKQSQSLNGKSEQLVLDFSDPSIRSADSQSPALYGDGVVQKQASEALKPTAAKKKSLAISIKDLTKIFVIGKEKVRALSGVSLDIYPGEIVCLLGTSGSGKSTLLNMMAGLEKPTKGSITIFGQRVDNMSERKLAKFRQKYMGFVFQSYNLLPNLNAIDNVAMPLMFSGTKKKIRDKEAKKMLKLCGLGKRMRHKPTQMSGGQQQRVGIARAFVAKPKIVFADEPTGNLDTRTTIEVMEMMVSMSRENHQTLIIVTHDTEIAAYADKIFHIIDGVISSVEDNTEKQIAVGSEEAAKIIAAAESV